MGRVKIPLPHHLEMFPLLFSDKSCFNGSVFPLLYLPLLNFFDRICTIEISDSDPFFHLYVPLLISGALQLCSYPVNTPTVEEKHSTLCISDNPVLYPYKIGLCSDPPTPSQLGTPDLDRAQI